MRIILLRNKSYADRTSYHSEVAERLDDVGSGYGLEITFKCVSVLSEPTQEQITKALGRGMSGSSIFWKVDIKNYLHFRWR